MSDFWGEMGQKYDFLAKIRANKKAPIWGPAAYVIWDVRLHDYYYDFNAEGSGNACHVGESATVLTP